MSVRARNPRSFTAIAATDIGDDNTQWIELLPVADEARNGRYFMTVTREDLETYAASIRANAGKVPVDYDHEGASDVGGSSRAAGWLTGQARIVDDPERGAILEGEVQWTPRAAQEIRDGEFRFISSEFSFEDRDKKSGLLTKAKDFIAATLTNRPFFSELAALAADGAVLWNPDQGVNQLQADLAEALNPGASNYDGVRFWVCDVDVTGRRALVCAAGPGDDTWIVPYEIGADGEVTVPPTLDWTPVEQAWVADTDDGAGMASVAQRFTALANHINERITAQGGSAATTQEDHVSDTLKALAADLGLPEDATDEQITEAVKTAKAAADRTAGLETELAEALASNDGGGDKVVTIDKAKLAELEQQAAQGVTARQAQLSTEADGLVAAAVKDGRIAPASRDSWRTAILPDGASGLVEAEAAALASLAKGRVPVDERVNGTTLTDANEASFEAVRASFGLKPAATATGKDN